MNVVKRAPCEIRRHISFERLYRFYKRIFYRSYGGNSSSVQPKSRNVVAFGNVLLDYTARVPDLEILDRYKISMNSRGEMDVETLSKITTEVIGDGEQSDPHLGGSSLNTVRILKKLGTEPLFFGAISKDKLGQTVNELLLKAGLDKSNFKLQTINDIPTGRCICLIHENSIALYANIGASSKFSVDFLKQIESDENCMFPGSNAKQLFYIEGFFVPQREDVITYIVRNYIKNGCHLVINLNANYIVKFNYHHMLYLANHALIIIGNKDEFDTFAECWDAKNIEGLTNGLTQNGAVTKIFIITNGADSVQLITNYVDESTSSRELSYQSFNATKIADVVDTTGCGDAFAAGFLHAWLQKYPLNECVRLACDVAANVATRIGCNLD